mmetsp:Transcript_66258/g.186584  ORF Transcript_66258/g.186584 Transcript_66258/m.186584 type:complete len:230 (+) Transcript_66258:711-1400(+)
MAVDEVRHPDLQRRRAVLHLLVARGRLDLDILYAGSHLTDQLHLILLLVTSLHCYLNDLVRQILHLLGLQPRQVVDLLRQLADAVAHPLGERLARPGLVRQDRFGLLDGAGDRSLIRLPYGAVGLGGLAHALDLPLEALLRGLADVALGLDELRHGVHALYHLHHVLPGRVLGVVQEARELGAQAILPDVVLLRLNAEARLAFVYAPADLHHLVRDSTELVADQLPLHL